MVEAEDVPEVAEEAAEPAPEAAEEPLEPLEETRALDEEADVM